MEDKVPFQLVPHVLQAVDALWPEMKVICSQIMVKLLEPMRESKTPLVDMKASPADTFRQLMPAAEDVTMKDLEDAEHVEDVVDK